MKQPASKLKTYRIKRVVWEQHELLYPQMTEMLAILGDLGAEFSAVFDRDDASFVGIAQGLFQKQLVPRIFGLVLRPHNSNPFRAFLNRFWMWRYGLTPANVVNAMTTSEWMEVLRDFFVESSKPILNLLPSGLASGSMSLTDGSASSGVSWVTTIFQVLAGFSQARKGFIMPPGDPLVTRTPSEHRPS